MVVMVSLAVTSLLLLILVGGSLICCIKKTRPVKRCEKSRHLSLYLRQKVSNMLSHELRFCPRALCRCLQSASGQSNPLFQSGSARGSPSLGPAHISQPIFVESSATQACKPLSSSRPTTAALKPSRAAPEVSSSSVEVEFGPREKCPVVSLKPQSK